MSNLRVLLVHDGSEESDSVSGVLVEAHHSVLPARGVDEAAEVLGLERFDAVLLGSALASDSLARFAVRVRTLNLSASGSAAHRTPILSLSFAPPPTELTIDAAIPPPFAASEFVAVLEDLSREDLSRGDLSRETPVENSGSTGESSAVPAILDINELRAQVGYDDELMIEIVDIFLNDWRNDLADMQASLETNEISKLGRQAHTIKGSLGSLHAEAAKNRAQALETAGAQLDEASCREQLPLLAAELELVAPLLQDLRDNPGNY